MALMTHARSHPRRGCVPGATRDPEGRAWVRLPAPFHPLPPESPMNRPLVSAVPRRPLATLASLAALGAAAVPLEAQLVTPRTIPVLQDAQFDIFPSARAGMA